MSAGIEVHSLPYSRDSALLFRHFSDLPDAVWLDSGLTEQPRAERDVLAALPTQYQVREVQRRAEALAALRALRRPPTSAAFPTPAPAFRGGVIACLGYEAGRHLLRRHEADPRPAPVFPSLWAGRYDWFIEVDHSQRLSRLFFLPDCPASTRALVLARLAATTTATEVASPQWTLTEPFQPQSTEAEYYQALSQIQAYLHAGDCYQVNYAQAFRARCVGDPYAAYLTLRQHSHSPYSAFLRTEQGCVLSLSPELFLTVRGDVIETRPIKGTRPRSTDPVLDAQYRAELQASQKDRAENLMIVDLLRNDLGQHALPGSVQVPELFAIESFSQVHHLVSEVRAQLAPGHDPLELLIDAFPGGSITGAPKRRAMEIIEELEPVARSVYCGSIGYLNDDGDMCFNIAIRTLLALPTEIWAWAGGGIVADSDSAAEYRECFSKIGRLLEVLEERHLGK